MSFTSKFRSAVGAAAVASVALVGLGSPAIAQEAPDRSFYLEEGESKTEEAYLYAGEDVYATCDSDCSDIDITLYTELGVEVDSDVELDAFPIVTAPFDGNFIIEVSMPDCDNICEVSLSSDEGF